MAFLDSTGLSHLWNKITAYVDEKVSSSGGTNTDGSGGTLVQQQVDYEQNDATKVDHIKNRPFYTSEKQTHNVIFGDKNTDYEFYKVGDIVPRTGCVNELTITVNGTNLETGEDVVGYSRCSDEIVIIETEGLRLTFFVVDGFKFEALFVYSDDNEEELPCGIYISGIIGVYNDVVTSGLTENLTVEIDYTFRKQIDPTYISINDTNAIKIYPPSDWELGDDLIIDDMDVFMSFFGLCYFARIRNVYLMLDSGDGSLLPIPFIHRGMGVFDLFLLFECKYALNVDDGWKLVCISQPETTEASTYGLRKPSLADMINASLEERGLTPSQIKEKFPKADFTKFLSNE